MQVNGKLEEKEKALQNVSTILLFCVGTEVLHGKKSESLSCKLGSFLKKKM